MLRQAAQAARSWSTSTATSRTAGLQATLDDRSRHRRAAGHHAAGDRRHALRRLRPAAGVDDVHAAQSVSRGDGSRAAVLAEPRRRCSTIYVTRHERRAGAARARSRSYAPTTTPLSVNHSGAVPVGHDLLQPGARHLAGRRGRRASTRPSARSGCRRRIHGSFQGTAQAFQASLANQPLLILAALVDGLHRAGHALRELHPPDHDPLHAAVGRRRRAAGAAAVPTPT